eukprot:4462947-Pleurochrysis_carterae.AAC.3
MHVDRHAARLRMRHRTLALGAVDAPCTLLHEDEAESGGDGDRWTYRKKQQNAHICRGYARSAGLAERRKGEYGPPLSAGVRAQLARESESENFRTLRVRARAYMRACACVLTRARASSRVCARAFSHGLIGLGGSRLADAQSKRANAPPVARVFALSDTPQEQTKISRRKWRTENMVSLGSCEQHSFDYECASWLLLRFAALPPDANAFQIKIRLEGYMRSVSLPFAGEQPKHDCQPAEARTQASIMPGAANLQNQVENSTLVNGRSNPVSGDQKQDRTTAETAINPQAEGHSLQKAQLDDEKLHASTDARKHSQAGAVLA